MTGIAPERWPRWRIWWLASRPKTLSAAVAPVLVGIAVAIAEDGFVLLPALAALLVGLFIQIGTNLYNDYADFQRGADTPDRLGPMRVTQAGLLAPEAVRRGAWLAFGLAGLVGSYLIWHAGWPVALLGGLAILAGLAYTAGPWPLAYNGLGDLFAWIFFGFAAVGGTAYVQVGQVSGLAWVGGLAIGGMITALLAVNNIRDIETDRVAGRKTIPVIFGRKGGLLEFIVCLLAAYLAVVLLSVNSRQGIWYLLPLLTAPEALRLFRYVRMNTGGELNQALGWTARLVLWFGVLMAIGIILAPSTVA
jgi:1,4-dihydroxy-2-naphthoate octaprenyltransferase